MRIYVKGKEKTMTVCLWTDRK